MKKNDVRRDDGMKSSKECSKPRQKVKFEGESEDTGSDEPERGVKGWLDGDYKVGDINFAIARVTEDRQVKTFCLGLVSSVQGCARIPVPENFE